MKIYYCEATGLEVADGLAENLARVILNRGDDCTVGNEITITAIRLIMLEQRISPKSVTFIVNGKEYQLGEDYEFIGKYPPIETERNLLERIAEIRRGRR